MRIRVYALIGIVFLICLIIDALTFGALVRESAVGPAIAASARAEAPLAQTYIVIGRPLTGAAPWVDDIGASMAGAAYGDAYGEIAAAPGAAIDLLFSASSGPLRALFVLFYWATPVALVLTMIAWIFRTRPTHLIKV